MSDTPDRAGGGPAGTGPGRTAGETGATPQPHGYRGFHESDEFARGIFDALAEGVLVVDHRGRIQAMNPSACRVLGFARGTLVGQNVRDTPWVLENEQERRLRIDEWPIVITLERGEPSGQLLVTHRPDGERRVIVMIAMPLPRPGGSPWTVVSLMDVTRERRAELALSASEGKFRQLVEQAPDPVFVVDNDGIIRVCNQRTADVFGYPASELVGRGIEMLVPESARGVHRIVREDYMAAPSSRAMGAGMGLSGRRRDGTEFPIEVSLSPIDTPQGPSVVAIARDITERLRAQEMMQVDRAKSAFLSRMSHELRTPLNSILGFGQLLEIGHPRDDQVEALEQIQRAGHHLLDLLNDLLEFERIRSGHVTFSIEPVNVAEAIDDALRLVEPTAQNARVSLLVDPDGATHAWASCDRQRFHQVLLNILSNAIKYNVPDGTVTVTATTNGTITSVGITDTGTGIEPSQLANLFVPFERLGADARSVEGAGVGLALSKMLTEGMGGKISVASRPGAGSTFTVSLHAAMPVEAIVEASDAETARTKFGDELRDTTVLYIEDNDANVRLVEAMLAMFGVRAAFSATTGEQGIAVAAQERPDVILLDLHLPDMPGEQVLRRLRAIDAARDVPVLIVTADANPGTSRRLLNAGVTGYITKPVGVGQLFDALVDAVKVNAP
ncbi:MAG TPA: PAS domain S-box protein [Acidimicrobiia bacterium]